MNWKRWGSIFKPMAAINLSLFRVVVFGCFLFLSDFETFDGYIRLPTDFRDMIPEISWMQPLLTSNENTYVIYWLFRVLCVMAIVGVFSRITVLMSTLLGIYILGIPHMYGKMYHYNHLVWFGFLLSVSPCADVGSVDAWWKARKSGIRQSLTSSSYLYSAPIYFVWILYGVIYLFPGLYKLFLGGWDWIFTDNLRTTVEVTNPRPLDQIPFFWLLDNSVFTMSSAFLVVFFEVTFFFAVFWERVRPYYVTIGFLFHSFVQLLFGFPFYTLRMCYVAFFNWGEILFRSSPPILKTLTAKDRRQLVVICGVGVFLVLINSYFGSLGRWGWPFTSYPTFHRVYDVNNLPARFDVAAYDAAGERVSLRSELSQLIQRVRGVRWRAQMKRHFSRDSVDKGERLREIWKELLKINPSLESKVYKLQVVRRTKRSSAGEGQVVFSLIL